jgi:hypothetical protein
MCASFGFLFTKKLNIVDHHHLLSTIITSSIVVRPLSGMSLACCPTISKKRGKVPTTPIG